MKWLVLGSSLVSQNGYGVLCRSVTEALGRVEGVELDVFTGDGRRDWRPGRSSLKSEWVASYPRLWFLFAALDLLILAMAGRSRYSGVLVLVEHYAAAGWLYSRWKTLPFVVVQHGTYAVKLPHDIPFYRHVLEKADRVLPVSNYTRRRMENEGIVARYVVVTPGVDVVGFRPPAEYGKRPVVLFVGNFKARKGLDFLVEAMAKASLRCPGIKLRIVGALNPASQGQDETARRIALAGVEAEFTGSLTAEKLREAYATARLNVLPSKSDRFYFEGFGLIHLEANACGTLTVGTLDSGNEDAIGEGFGSLVRYGDVDALAGCIMSAMTVDPYPELPLSRLRTWDDVANDYAQILKETAG